MWKALCRWILYGCLGWTAEVTEEHPKKYIVCMAPHTSNMDFCIGMLYSYAEGIKTNFLMKEEWFRGPLGVVFKRMGGIPVCRTKHTSMTDSLAATAATNDTFRLCITPEGTRSRNPDWKMGFYYIACKARLPILLYGLDYTKKRIQCTRTVIPNGDAQAQMREIKLYFKDFKGKHPENFTIGEI